MNAKDAAVLVIVGGWAVSLFGLILMSAVTGRVITPEALDALKSVSDGVFVLTTAYAVTREGK